MHIDHVGRVPYLLAAGFEGPIYCSLPSAILLPLVIEDALAVGATRDRKLVARTLERLKSQIRPLAYGKWARVDTGIGTGLEIRLQRAGHILGSAYVECRITAPPVGSALADTGIDCGINVRLKSDLRADKALNVRLKPNPQTKPRPPATA